MKEKGLAVWMRQPFFVRMKTAEEAGADMAGMRMIIHIEGIAAGDPGGLACRAGENIDRTGKKL